MYWDQKFCLLRIKVIFTTIQTAELLSSVEQISISETLVQSFCPILTTSSGSCNLMGILYTQIIDQIDWKPFKFSTVYSTLVLVQVCECCSSTLSWVLAKCWGLGLVMHTKWHLSIVTAWLFLWIKRKLHTHSEISLKCITLYSWALWNCMNFLSEFIS